MAYCDVTIQRVRATKTFFPKNSGRVYKMPKQADS
jgi:hypothetical protein